MLEDRIMSFVAAILFVGGCGGLIYNISKKKESKKSSGVTAQNNSVAIGNDNSGDILLIVTDANSSVTQAPQEKVSLLTFWNILCGVATFVGLYIGLTSI